MGRTPTKRATAEVVNGLADRLQEAEARLASMAAALDALKVRLKETANRSNGDRPEGQGPPLFWDEDGPHAPVALVKKSVLGPGGDEVRALFEERGALTGEFRDMHERRRRLVAAMERWLAIQRGDARAFPRQGAPHPQEQEASGRVQALDAEIDALDARIVAVKDRLEEIFDTVKRDYVVVQLAQPVIREPIPQPTARRPGEE